MTPRALARRGGAPAGQQSDGGVWRGYRTAKHIAVWPIYARPSNLLRLYPYRHPDGCRSHRYHTADHRADPEIVIADTGPAC